ncbi:hypothetical protein BSUBE1_0894 [Bacillus subtilis E1]|nr:hypothetical protein BSUBE1_0894 [Bacillus subtilis E1]
MHYSYYPYPVPYREDPVLIRNLQKAINGEFSAIQCYRKLAELAHSDEVRKQIEEIRRDEIRHLREFSTLYGSITGKHIMPKQTEECPAISQEDWTPLLKMNKKPSTFTCVRPRKRQT